MAAGFRVPRDACACQPSRYESRIVAFEAQDRQTPPPADPTLFVGSSTFTLWKTLPEDFREFHAINRGFGGSTVRDILYYTDRVVLAYRPRAIVFYAGTNDLALGRSPETIAAEFVAFTQRVHGALPNVQIYFVSITPAPSRQLLAGKMDETNRLIHTAFALDSRFHYIDTRWSLCDAHGRPRTELYKFDLLHPNAKAYAIWRDIIANALRAPAAAADSPNTLSVTWAWSHP